ncbi:PPC domain-containing DNA-binding protein [Flavobacterium sp.]|uniref:PPC domain-containing DNA-binding protein n=1 Tax=Flavobacterium sp. TaxID=239 RepID=UPI0039E3054B
MKKLFLLLILFAISAHAQTPETKRYTKVPKGYLMVLKQGDDLFKELEKFAITENIPSANLTGMGFASSVTFGFFNSQTKQFERQEFKKVEIASLNGTIAQKLGKYSIHAHGVVTGRDFTAHGGHMLFATVGTGSVEIMILVHDKTFVRQYDPKIGADVLCLENCK